MAKNLALLLALFAFGCAGAEGQRRRAAAEERLAAAEFEVNAAQSEDVWRYARPLLDNAKHNLAQAKEKFSAKKFDVAGRWARSASVAAKKAVDYAQKVKAREAALEAQAAAEEARMLRKGKTPEPKPARKIAPPPQGP